MDDTRARVQDAVGSQCRRVTPSARRGPDSALHRTGVVIVRYHLLDSQDLYPPPSSCCTGKDLHEQFHPRTSHG